MVNDPFADPMVMTAQGILQRAGIKTVYSKVYPAENPDYQAGADAVAATGAQMVVLGSVDVPTVSAFMTAFEQQHYNPGIMAASAGPDQGAAFLKAVGANNANGIFVPNGWYGGFQNSLSHAMVNAYIAKYHGTPADINADVAEAYSVGQVAAAAITATKRHRQQEDHQLPAQRRQRADGAGRGEIQHRRGEHDRHDVHVPVAADRQVRAGAAGRRSRIPADTQPEAALGQLSRARRAERRWVANSTRPSSAGFSVAVSTR